MASCSVASLYSQMYGLRNNLVDVMCTPSSVYTHKLSRFAYAELIINTTGALVE